MVTVTPLLAIGDNNKIPGTPVRSALAAKELMLLGRRVNVPTPVIAIQTLVLLNVEPKTALTRVKRAYGTLPEETIEL